MSKKGNFKKNSSKGKKNTYSNNVSLVKQQKEENKNTTSLTKQPKKNDAKNVVTPAINEEQASENVQAKYIMILSFAFLGFLFAFLANYGFFDLQKALLAGFWGIAGGAGFAYLPYWLASREK